VLRGGDAGEIYNVGADNERHNIDVAEQLFELTGADRGLLRRVDDRPGHDRRYSLDSSKLHALGWKPQTGFEEGLRATVDWYREHRAWWEPIKSGEYREYYEQQYGERLASGTSV
jgi:dTDP-glucose 4,6-dehydratase